MIPGRGIGNHALGKAGISHVGYNGVEALRLGELCRGLDTLHGLLELCRVPRDNDDVCPLGGKDACGAEAGALGTARQENSLWIQGQPVSLPWPRVFACPPGSSRPYPALDGHVVATKPAHFFLISERH